MSWMLTIMSEQISIQKDFVAVKGGKLATVLKQSSNPIADVVLVHGFTGSKEDFAKLSELLAEMNFRVLTFDNRGQHESSHASSDSEYAMSSLAADVIALTRHYEFKSPHLFGHSLGGLIAQQATVLEPTLWRSLTLFCSGPSGKPDWFNDPQFMNLNNETKLGIWQEILAPQHTENPKGELLQKRWLASDANSTLALHNHLRSFASKISEIAGFNIPAHVVYGDLDDVWPLDEQNEMARVLNAQITILEGYGHCPNEENPYLTAQALAAFWNKVI